MEAKTTSLYIKNMVCPRCIKVVETTLSDMGFHVGAVQLGEVLLQQSLSKSERTQIEQALNKWDFELLQDKDEKVISQIKSCIVDLVHYEETDQSIKNSDYITSKVGGNYASLSKLFSQFEGITIEKYIIQQRIERVKELLSYGELTLSEIAAQLQYSSVQHLSRQFKKVAGVSVTEFKKLQKADQNRRFLNDI